MNRLLRKLQRVAWAEDHKVQWTADQVAHVLAKISKSLNEKTGKEMMMEFFHDIAEENTNNPVYLLDKYWRSYADLRIKTVYNIPRIISGLKNKNPNLSGEKFYSRIKQILVQNNSPWLQLYYDFYHGHDLKRNPVNLETIQKTYQWPKIEEELKRTYTPMSKRNQAEMNYEKELASRPQMINLLKQYDTPENRDAANKINAICIVWNQHKNEFKTNSTDLDELYQIIQTWKSYMEDMYTELSKIPVKYVTVYDQFQIEKLLNDAEHYGALERTIANLKLLSNHRGKMNGAKVYQGLQNMYLAAKGQTIRPFNVQVSKESLQQQKQYEYELDKATAFSNKKNKPAKPKMQFGLYLDKFNKVNPLIALMEKNIFTEDDFEQIEDLEELKSTVDYFKNKLTSLSATMAQEVANTHYDFYAFDDAKVSKMFSRQLYGNIDKQIQLMEPLDQAGDLDFEHSFNGKWLWKCINSMYNFYKTGAPPILVGIPAPKQISTPSTTAMSRLRKLRR